MCGCRESVVASSDLVERFGCTVLGKWYPKVYCTTAANEQSNE